MNETIFELKQRQRRLIDRKSHEDYLGTNDLIDNEIDSIAKKIRSINEKYFNMIKENLHKLSIDDVAHIMKKNNVSYEEAIELITEEIKERNNDDYENFYNALLFLKSRGITAKDVEEYNKELAKLAFAKNSRSYLRKLSGVIYAKNIVQSEDHFIEQYRKEIDLYTRTANALENALKYIDMNVKNRSNYNTKDIEREMNELCDKRDALWIEKQEGKDAVRINKKVDKIEAALAIKMREKDEIQQEVNKLAYEMWNNISPLDRKALELSIWDKESFCKDFAKYIKENPKNQQSDFLNTLNNQIRTMKNRLYDSKVRKRIADVDLATEYESPVEDIDRAIETQESIAKAIIRKDCRLYEFTAEELDNIVKAGVNKTTILATPKTKKIEK